MIKINLRDFYPFYNTDLFIEIPDEVEVALLEAERLERKMTAEQLRSAMASLPDKQGKRIYAHYILGISKSDIARAEGVDEKAVRVSIERGLRNMEKFLKNF